mmetsp:Transcript_34406/g.97016  ORF Transcript_34406/g.97016 Transcript_34406/m.97016 type:complete len:253 (-) Transcript_34406:986-1744(-)
MHGVQDEGQVWAEELLNEHPHAGLGLPHARCAPAEHRAPREEGSPYRRHRSAQIFGVRGVHVSDAVIEASPGHPLEVLHIRRGPHDHPRVARKRAGQLLSHILRDAHGQYQPLELVTAGFEVRPLKVLRRGHQALELLPSPRGTDACFHGPELDAGASRGVEDGCPLCKLGEPCELAASRCLRSARLQSSFVGTHHEGCPIGAGPAGTLRGGRRAVGRISIEAAGDIEVPERIVRIPQVRLIHRVSQSSRLV